MYSEGLMSEVRIKCFSCEEGERDSWGKTGRVNDWRGIWAVCASVGEVS